MTKIGVILARFQPIHNGHIELIRKALNENDKLLILLGSADKFNNRNPIPSDLRYDLVVKSLESSNFDMNKIAVIKLDDLSNESDNTLEWGFYLYSNIVKHIKQDNFTIYYSDGFEIITTWFPGYVLRNHISLSLMARTTIENGISATKVREYIEKANDEELKSCVPLPVFEMRNILNNFIKISQKSL